MQFADLFLVCHKICFSNCYILGIDHLVSGVIDIKLITLSIYLLLFQKKLVKH